VGLEAILESGVRGKPDVDAIAARSERDITVMAWNYHDDDVAGPDARISATVAGVPAPARRVLLRHYRIDRDHSNAYTLWKEMGSPQSLTSEQYARLEAAGQLELLDSPRWLWNENGSVEIAFTLPRQGVSLVQLSW
jgi:xylan 1,4-beta-xylosidase